MEDVADMEEEVVAIRIAPSKPGTVLTSEIFIRILAVPIGMLSREMVEHMLAVNTSMERTEADAVTAVHEGDVDVAEDGTYHKLKLISLTPDVEDVTTKETVNRLALALEEERIDS